MKTKTIKKIALNIFVISQVVILGLGSALPASAASWASLRYDLDEDEVPPGIDDQDEYEVVSSYKKEDQSPKVSVMFTPTNPKAGEKVTATAMAAPFANEPKDLYYTWFLKRKGCDLEVKKGDKTFATDSQAYDPDHLSERNADNEYPTHEQLSNEVPEGDALSQQECDSDLDGLITVNDWKTTAGKLVVQNGFKPDLGGKYDSDGQFYADGSDKDNDGYVTWQGGADAERMPNHCYGYDSTSGIMFEYLDQFLDGAPMCPNPDGSDEKIPAVCGQSKQWTPPAATEDPCACSTDLDSPLNGSRDIAGCIQCSDGTLFVNATAGYDYKPALPAGFTLPTAGEAATTYRDGRVQWFECLIDQNYCDAPNATVGPEYAYSGGVGAVNESFPGLHMDCHTQTSLSLCEKQTAAPRCTEITTGDSAYIGQYAAVCGDDADGNGIDDNYDTDYPGVPICPSRGIFKIGDETEAGNPFIISEPDFTAAVTSGESYNSTEYIFGRAGRYEDYDKLPVCSCNKVRTLVVPAGDGDTPLPFTGGTGDDALCQDRSPEISDLLCGSLTTSSAGTQTDVTMPEDQFHLFPQRLADSSGNVDENYYERTRTYDTEDEDKYTYKKGNNTGDGDFGLTDEKYWGTDPRNPSTAGNGRFDEANLVGVGAETFTWTYAEGDSIGVAVEGTSNLGTKFPDSSRMIMWAFSKGVDAATNSDDEADVACQPKYSGTYNFADLNDMQHTGLVWVPNMIKMPTGFMDFDRCIEKSTIPIIPGGGANGAQPAAMEVELDVTPDNPLNDENGEGQGDVVDAQASVTGSVGTSNELNYAWKITRFKPGINAEGLSPIPTERDWTGADAEVLCGSGASGICPFQSSEGGKLNLEGIGNDELMFGLNINKASELYDALFNANGDGYLKINLEVRENANDAGVANSRVGWGEAVVKVSSNQNRITVFRPEVVGGKLAGANNVKCAEGTERSVCSVLKNDIVGLMIPSTTNASAASGNSEDLTQFQWTLNGRDLSGCDKAMSEACENGKSTNTTFVPVLGEVGETFLVNVKASNISGQAGTDQTGKKVDLTQQFRIVEPSVKIVSTDQALTWPKLIGSVIDPTLEEDSTGKYTSDYSKSILETAAGNNPTFRLDYVPRDLGSLGLVETWQIDGSLSSTHSFTAGSVGTVHNVSATVSYAQSPEMNRMLSTYFGVANSQMTKQAMSDAIQVEVNQTARTAAIKSTTRFMANLLSKIPQQILFFIRLILSVAMTVVLVGMVFAFFPETAYGRRRE